MDNEKDNIQNDEVKETELQDEASEMPEAPKEINDKIIDESPEEEVAEADEALVEEERVEEPVNEETGEVLSEEPSEEELAQKKKKTVKYTIIGVVAVVVLALLALVGYKVYENYKYPNTVAVVAGNHVSADEYQYFLTNQAAKYAYNLNKGDSSAKVDWKTVNKETGKTYAQEVIEATNHDVQTFYVPYSYAVKKGFTLSKEEKTEFENWVKQSETQFGKELFGNMIKAQYGIANIETYKKMITMSQVIQKLSADYEQNPDKYKSEMADISKYLSNDKVSVKHVLIMADQNADAEKKAAALEKAKEVLKKAKAGEDFDKLVKEYNEDTGETEEGYTFGKGEMVAEFEKAAFALKVNQVSDIVATDYGFHIIKRIERKADFTDLEEKWIANTKSSFKNRKINKMEIKTSLLTDDEMKKIQEQYAAKQQATAQSTAGATQK